MDIRRRRAVARAALCFVIALGFTYGVTRSGYSANVRLLWAGLAVLWVVLGVVPLLRKHQDSSGAEPTPSSAGAEGHLPPPVAVATASEAPPAVAQVAPLPPESAALPASLDDPARRTDEDAGH